MDALKAIHALPLWQGEITAKPLSGGLTNLNYLVRDQRGAYVVRLGADIAEHQLMRFNELAASRAAEAAGLSPKVLYAETGVLVLEYIDSTTLAEADVRDDKMLARLLPLIKSCHQKIPNHLRGPSLIFWVFHVVRDYAAQLQIAHSPHAALLPELLTINLQLETAAAPFDIVFGHNDLLAGNFLDDGNRLWLIDWDYAGFNSPLFDLGGLAANNGLSVAQETWLLETYFDTKLTPDLWQRYMAMKSAALLRECLWSMVSEMTSSIDFDYGAYTSANLARFRTAHSDFLQL